MPKLTPKILNLSNGDRYELQQLIDRHNTPQQIALRAKIILMASEGQNNREIAIRLDIDLDFAGEFVKFVWGCDELEINSQQLYAWWD
ncbi:hypothetical protein H6G80_30390 [Nostoc sp. FACHB-87]|uniref:hypothetical protein n=1 Tax=Nostocaceae TaxID=1162 RepID=UPI001687B516|nr:MULTISPECIES: hypothetical protein [Nostocaceae]MBD2458364.1 hypothetical protein [Nostoc sp. FACHB-87]MBD2479543.1 hypothetical protein [Anabaena sp. FACHB-83]